MSSFQYYSAPGFGQVAREEYGFSDACIISDRMEVTGQGQLACLHCEDVQS